MKQKASIADYVIQAILMLLAVMTILPFYNVFITSFADPAAVARQQFYLVPTSFDLNSYRMLLDGSYVGRALTNDGALLADAVREHAQAQESIVRIESMTSDSPTFGDEVTKLAGLVAEHVNKEEQELFPKVTATTMDLTALGIALAERRDTLLDVLGLHGDDEEGAANQRETHPNEPARRTL